jgi:IS30 family transposase
LSYKHFTLFERESLQLFLSEGKSFREIAKIMGRSPSTISREVRRNWNKKAKHYNFWHAQTNYLHRRKRCHRKNNLENNPEIFSFVFNSLMLFWSPEIIAGKWNTTHKEKIACTSIYRAVRAGLFPGIKPWTHFRRKAKPYANQKKSYTRFFDSSIHDRPEIINQRGRLGDFEGDTVYGSVGKGYLITGIDRQSRQLVAAIAKDKKIESTNAAFISAFANAEIKVTPLTLTLDNGTEFLGFKDLEKALDIKVYFADSHAPWQRKNR